MCQLNMFHLPDVTDFDGIIILANTFNIPDEAERVKHLFVDKGVPALSLEVQGQTGYSADMAEMNL